MIDRTYRFEFYGVKLQTRHRTPTLSPAAGMGVANESTEESVTDYCGSFIYEDGELTRINLENGYLSYRSYSGQKLEVPEYVFYLRDHLGNNRVTMSSGGGIYQIDHFYPFGLPMGCSYNSSHQQWRFGGKELDRTAGLDLYDFEARAYDPSTARFTCPDPLAEKYNPFSPMAYCANTPLINIDPTGKEVTLYATDLPGAAWVPFATHTFITVTDQSGALQGYFAYGANVDGLMAALGLGGTLQQNKYSQDRAIINGTDTEHLKAKITIPVPDDMTQEEFDNAVINTANSFGNNPFIKYKPYPDDPTEGNCNSSTSTILLKSGVTPELIEQIESMIPGINWGFSSTPKPWTAEEQKQAVEIQQIMDNSINSTTVRNM